MCRTFSAVALAGVCGAASPCLGQCGLEPFETAALDGRAVWLTLYPTTDPVPGVYMSGTFRVNGVRTGLVKRVNGAWVPVPGAPESLGAMTQHIEPNGAAALYVGADDPNGGPGAYELNLYRFDGTSWETRPALAADPFSHIDSLASVDLDGGGPDPAELYVLTSYNELGSAKRGTINGGVRRWTGSEWVGTGNVNSGSGQLIVYDSDGPGPGLPNLYAIGRRVFYNDQVVESEDGRLTRLAANRQLQLVALLTSPSTGAVYDPDGIGPQTPVLAIGGTFTEIVQGSSTIPASHIAFFNGATFAVPGGGLPGSVEAMAHFDPDGIGPLAPKLVVAGRFGVSGGAAGDGLVSWDGAAWAPFAGGLLGESGLLRAFDEDAGGARSPELVWSGRARIAGRSAAPVAVYTETGWQGLFTGPSGPVRALDIFNGELIVGGRFDRCGETIVNNVAVRRGGSWVALGAGLPPAGSNPVPQVLSMAVHDDGHGPALYVGGSFQLAGAVGASNVARWTGAEWHRVGQSGLSGGAVYALVSHDPDGVGPLAARLYAGGAFTLADGAPAPRVAFWDGETWRGVEGAAGVLTSVRAFKSWNDGSGPALYVAGEGLPGSSHLVWQLGISGWVGLPPLVSVYDPRRINALEVHDDGTGPKLYAAGRLSLSDDPTFIQRLVGSQWQTAPPFFTRSAEIWALRSIGSPSEPMLLAGDTVLTPAHYLGGALDPQADAAVRAISPAFSDQTGTGVILGGEFLAVTPPPPLQLNTFYEFDDSALRWGTPFLARFHGCDPCFANCDGSTAYPVLNVLDFNCFLNRFSAGDGYANCDGSTVAPVLNVLDFNCFLNRFSAGCP